MRAIEKAKIISIVLFFTSLSIKAQEVRSLEGHVTDMDGKPIAEVTVSPKGFNLTATTNEKGHYSISVPDSILTLIFTHPDRESASASVGLYDKVDIRMSALGSTDIAEMSLEDLMNMEITSVSKKTERLQDVASSIYVLTSDEIMKTGATTLHEVLRTVPGYWGTQDEYSSVKSSVRVSRTLSAYDGSVLYLLDGSPIQDLMTSSFEFRNFDIPLSEIERIEVIRGSGGTIYGANSATGVVNIFTKNPGDYSGLVANAEGASPGYGAVSISVSGSLSEKLSASGYAKLRYFKGFESMRGVDENGNQTVANSRFTKNYDKSTMSSAGLKADYNISDKTKISMRTHFNALKKYDYASYFTENSLDLLTQTITNDVLVEKEINLNRLVSNLRLDHSFNDAHSLFFRISTNQENDFIKVSGGYEVSNAIYDFEIQDNVALGSKNDLSFGANYRMVNFDIHDITYTNGINFIDPQAKESIKAVFVQDKLKLMDDKLNFILGIKAENYSLINDEYYLSPMAKVSFIPSDKLTIWGGYTQSFTTPGFELTNIDLYLFETPPIETWAAVASQAIYGQVYTTAYETAIGLGAPEASAVAAATTAATGYVSSPEGQATIAATASNLQLQTPNVALRNGNTTPTKFKTLELGFRVNPVQKLSFESNLFYTNVEGGFTASSDMSYEESITQPGRFASYFQYGNFLQGTTYGAESKIRLIPSNALFFELSHSFIKSTWEYNFDDDDPIFMKDKTPDNPEIPEHIIRFRTSYDITDGLNVNLGVIYASQHMTQSGYNFDSERYPAIGFTETSTIVAEDNSRTIVNLRIEKKLMSEKLSIYAFGNDIFNKGIIAQTDNVYNVTLSKIGAMYGIGIKYDL